MATASIDVISASWIAFMHAPGRGSAVEVVLTEYQHPASLKVPNLHQREEIKVQRMTCHFRIQKRCVYDNTMCWLCIGNIAGAGRWCGIG